jgi:hypothetical protein
MKHERKLDRFDREAARTINNINEKKRKSSCPHISREISTDQQDAFDRLFLCIGEDDI